MKTARLIKFQEKAEELAATQKRLTVTAPQETVRTWLSEYQQQKPRNPREQFAHLFKFVA
jgi:hypothetical protein